MSNAQRRQVYGMVVENKFTCTQIACTAECSVNAVKQVQRNIRTFGSAKAPRKVGGRPRVITSPMSDALCDYLLEKPG